MPPTLTVPTVLPGVELTETARLLKMLVHGHSGSGKTRLALSFCQDPRTSPALVLDPTGGTAGVLHAMKDAGASVRPIDDVTSIEAYTTWLVANKGGGFKSLIVDDFSESFSLTKGKVSRSFGHTSAEELDPREHPRLYERALKVYRAARTVASPVEAGGAGVHVVFLCWTERKEDTEKVAKWVPRFAGQFGFQTPAYFDIVGYLEATVRREKTAGKEDRTVTFENTLITMSREHLVKDRFGALPPVLPMPTATSILDSLEHVQEQTRA